MADNAKFVITGEFDPSRMINKINATMKAVKANIQNSAKESTKVANKEFNKIKLPNAKDPLGTGGAKKDIKKINADLFTAVRRVILWGAAARLVFESFQNIKNATKDVIKLNETLINIQKIRPEGFSTAGIEKNILGFAKEFGVAFDEIAETQRTFFQQGFKVEEVSKLTKAQLLGVAAAGLTAAESMEFLIGTMSIFRIEANRSITILDKLQNVQANYAVSTQDLAAAVRRVGPAAKELNEDFDNLIGVITTLKSVTRKSGEFIGTTLRTVFSRILTITGENALRNVGVAIRSTAADYRPLNDILDDIAKKWETLTSVQRQNLAFSLGARRRYTEVVALFSNYDIAQKAAIDSAQSFGAATMAQQKELTSYSRQLKILQENMRQIGMEAVKNALFSVTGTSDMSKAIRKLSASVAYYGDKLKFVAKHMKYVVAAGISLVGILTSLSVASRLATIFATLSTSLITLKAGFVGLAGAGAVFGATAPLIAGVLLLSSAIFGAVHSLKLFKKEAEGVKKSVVGVFNVKFDTLKPAIQKNLMEYLEVVKQFQDLGGVKFQAAMESINENLISVGKNVSDLSFEEIQGKLKDFGIEVENTSELILELDTVIGFNKLIKSGLGQEFSKLKQNIAGVGSEIAVLGTRLSNVSEGRTFGETLQYVFGMSEKDIRNLEQKYMKYQGVLSGEIISPTTFIGDMEFPVYSKEAFTTKTKKEYYDAVTKVLAGNELLKRLNTEFGDLGIEVGSLIEHSIMLALNRASVDAPAEDFSKYFTQALSNSLAAHLKTLPINLKNMMKNKGVNVGDFLEGKTDQPWAKGFSEATISALKKMYDTVSEFEAAAMSPFVQSIEDLRTKLKESSSSVLNFAKGMSLLYKATLRNKESLAKLPGELEQLGIQAAFTGSSFAKLAKTLIGNKLKETLEIFAKTSNLEEYGTTVAGLRTKLKDLNETMKLHADNKDTINIYKDAANAARKVQDELSNYEAQIKETEKANVTALVNLKKLIKQYNGLSSAINTEVLIHERESKIIDIVAEGYESLNKTIKGFSKSTVKNIKDILLLGAGGSSSKRIAAFRREVNLTYKLELTALKEAKRIKLESLSLKEKEITRHHEAQNAVALTNATEGERLVIETKINEKLQEQYRKIELGKVQAIAKYDADVKTLGVQRDINYNLALQNEKVAVLKDRYKDLESYAKGFASSLAAGVSNFADLITKHAGGTEFLETISDSYFTALEGQLSKALSGAFMNVIGGGLENQIKAMEAQLDQNINTAKYQTYGQVLHGYISSAIITSGNYLAQQIMTASGVGFAGITNTLNPVGPQVVGSEFPDLFDAQNNLLVTGNILNSGSLNVNSKQLEVDIKQLKKTQQMAVGIQTLGVILGQLGAFGDNAEGSKIGSGLGGIIGGAAFATGPYGAVAAAAGSILGGWIGGNWALSKSEEDPKEIKKAEAQITSANTDAIRNNTQATINNTQAFLFMSKLINAPSDFVTPAFAQQGGTAPIINVTVHGSGNASSDVYEAVSRAYSDNARRIGRRG